MVNLMSISIFAVSLFWIISFLSSIFWGMHGYAVAKIDEEKSCIIRCGYVVSEFMGSFMGWLCLYISLKSIHIENVIKDITVVHALLLLGAFIGISGWSYKIADILGLIADYLEVKVENLDKKPKDKIDPK